MKNTIRTIISSALFSALAWIYFNLFVTIGYSWPICFERIVEFLGGPVLFLAVSYGIIASVALTRLMHFDTVFKILLFVIVTGIFHAAIYKTMVHFASGDTVFAIQYMLITAIISTAICIAILLISCFIVRRKNDCYEQNHL